MGGLLSEGSLLSTGVELAMAMARGLASLQSEIQREILLCVGYPEMAANLSSEEIGDFSMSGDRGDPAWIGEIYVFAVFGSFIGESASEPF
jgi:hypothetical protein